MAAGLRQGDTVVDYGCGPGFFTFAAAEISGPEGDILAYDKEPSMVKFIDRKIAEKCISTVTSILGSDETAPFPPNTADFLILGQVLHYPKTTSGRLALARDVKRLLKSDGRAMVIEWIPENEHDGRLSQDDVKSVLSQVKLHVNEIHSLGPRQYMMVVTHVPRISQS